MNNEFINDNDYDLVFGKKIIINDELILIPVYNLKINNVNLDGEKFIKGTSKSVNINPICFLEIYKSNIKIHSLSNDLHLKDIIDKAPNIVDMVFKIINNNE